MRFTGLGLVVAALLGSPGLNAGPAAFAQTPPVAPAWLHTDNAHIQSEVTVLDGGGIRRENRVIAKIREQDIARLELGQSAKIRIDAFPDAVFAGRISKIATAPVRPVSGPAQAPPRREVELTFDAAQPALTSPNPHGLSAMVDILITSEAR